MICFELINFYGIILNSWIFGFEPGPNEKTAVPFEHRREEGHVLALGKLLRWAELSPREEAGASQPPTEPVEST